MAYQPIPYPSWRYHPSGEARVVQTQEESDALGPGWAHSPSAAAAAPAQIGRETTTAGAAEEIMSADAQPDEAAAELYRLRVGDIIASLDLADTPEQLVAVQRLEEANPVVIGGRKTVLKAIAARIATLTGN